MSYLKPAQVVHSACFMTPHSLAPPWHLAAGLQAGKNGFMATEAVFVLLGLLLPDHSPDISVPHSDEQYKVFQ